MRAHDMDRAKAIEHLLSQLLDLGLLAHIDTHRQEVDALFPEPMLQVLD